MSCLLSKIKIFLKQIFNSKGLHLWTTQQPVCLLVHFQDMWLSHASIPGTPIQAYSRMLFQGDACTHKPRKQACLPCRIWSCLFPGYWKDSQPISEDRWLKLAYSLKYTIYVWACIFLYWEIHLTINSWVQDLYPLRFLEICFMPQPSTSSLETEPRVVPV